MPDRRMSISKSARLSRSGSQMAPGAPTHGVIPHHDQVDILKEETQTGDHFLTPEQLGVVYRTNLDSGLTTPRAKELLEEFGPNELQDLRGNRYCDIFRHNLFGWFQCVLWVGAFLNFGAYILEIMNPSEDEGAHEAKEYLYLGIIITGTIIGTGLFGFYQEAKNVSVMSGFEKMVPPDATVVRDGVIQTIPCNELVPGDIVEMKQGEMVPADVRILSCSNFKTDGSALTGESKPVVHRPECTHSNPLESRNMAFSSCPIVEGNARGVAVATGVNTQIGKIAGLVTGLQKVETPIAKELAHFLKLICIVAFVLGILFFIIVYMVQKKFITAFSYMLGIILANVPEGLLVTLTACMTLSAKQLKKKNCLAKSLQAVETLGSTSVICSDKTGTLTINKMSVSHLFCNSTIIDKNDHSNVDKRTYMALCRAASLNLKAKFAHDSLKLPVTSRKILGDASESAILRYMEVYRSATKTREENKMVAEIPFNSAYKYQVTIHEMKDTQDHLLLMKGAPEIVLEHCSSVYVNEEIMDLTDDLKKENAEFFIKLANMGERVIGYSELKLPLGEYPLGFQFDTQNVNFPVEGLCFIGAISMIDPPREEVHDAIKSCRQAGIKVTMVTGDHPVTALAISREVGTITQPTAYDYSFAHHIEVHDVPPHVKQQFNAAVVTGDDLRQMSADQLQETIKKYKELTFARTSPQQKLFIVENYQALGYIVAVTGDGVNDSPALKKADIGIAMGITGTEVSKQAADMILLDDNFASIVLGVKEGRRIFDNLKKTIAYTFTSNTPEMMPFVLYATVGLPLPLPLMLILVINVGTDLMPAMSLAYEDSEGDVMKIPPRKVTDHLVNRALLYMAYYQVGMIQFLSAIYAYFVIFAHDGFFPDKLLWARENWENRTHPFTDSFGRDWMYEDRKETERRAQTGYFVAVCWTQVSDVIICKTRRVSLLQKGMRNHILNISILVSMFCAVLVTYTPICHEVFSTESLDAADFFIAIPFMVFMILADEFRRFLIRRNVSDWIEKNLYY